MCGGKLRLFESVIMKNAFKWEFYCFREEIKVLKLSNKFNFLANANPHSFFLIIHDSIHQKIARIQFLIEKH